MLGGTTALIVLVAGTPLSFLWFERVSALAPQLTEMARLALWIAMPMPGLNVLQSWFQGLLLHSRKTRGITEAVGISLLTTVAILIVGVVWGGVTGLYVGWFAISAGSVAQTIWLWMRSRSSLKALETSLEVGLVA
jgi:O-antigen/teichoic acid export membrane protein